jgi:hypothetical protein
VHPLLPGDGGADPLRQPAQPDGRDPRRQDGELVAAEPGRGVLGPDLATQPIADRLQDNVPDRVPVGVVDEFEVVEIDVDQPDVPTSRRPERPGRGVIASASRSWNALRLARCVSGSSSTLRVRASSACFWRVMST